MQDSNVLVLEVLKQEQSLAMTVFAQKELTSTLRHYSNVAVSFPEVNRLCDEITFALNKINFQDPQLINSLKKAGQLLWDQLLSRPVKDKLRQGQDLDLVLSLDEELIHIPWELLYDGRDFLSLKFNLGRLVRTKQAASPLQYRSPPRLARMLVLANPTNDLKSAYLEGTFIKNQFDRKRRQISIDFKSTHIDTLYVKKNLRDYDIVHFAGHCEYDTQDSKNSGWILADGRFTVRDIYAMGQALPALIFSNACHSAGVTQSHPELDYQEKTYNLACAFLFSGVRHYLGTIRKIEDPVSLVFAREFYSQLISGKSVGECVRLGRLRLIKEYGIASLFWVSHLLYGDPNFILFRKIEAPMRRRSINIHLSKKVWGWFMVFLALFSICIYLYIWLPTVNPNVYLMFFESRNLFLRGKNEEVIALSQRIAEKEPLFLAVYPLVGDAFHRLGKREEALKYYFEYARQSEKKKDAKNLSSAYIGIGWIYQAQGDYQKASDFYDKALNLSRKSRDKANEAIALRKFAVWHIDKEDYDKALELLMKSSEINRERQKNSQYRYNLACDYFDIGLVFVNKDDFVTAKGFYHKSRHIFEKLKLKYELSDYYFNLGEIYLYDKQYQKALDYYLQGLKIDQIQQNLPSLASDYNMLGELYVEMNDLQGAEEYFNQAVEISRKIDAPVELAQGYYNLGLLYKQKNQKNKARQYLRLAQEIYSRIDTPDYQMIKQEFLSLDPSLKDGKVYPLGLDQ